VYFEARIKRMKLEEVKLDKENELENTVESMSERK
jgi:hypothetical protein